MNVGELVKELRKVDPDLPVLIPRSDCSALEDVVACYADVVREGQVMGYESHSWFPWEHDASGAEKLQAVVIDFSQQFPVPVK